MSPDQLKVLQLCRAEVDDYLGQAVSILSEERDAESETQVAGAHRLANTYVRLAAVSLERFKEVANGL